jgi:hypothetical protein
MSSHDSSPEEGIADGLTIVSYAADSKGKQALVPGSFWQPVNDVNRQAWLEIEKHIEVSQRKVASGKVSCLHFYMTANQMDVGLLAQYSNQARWRVRLHLRPFFFNRLGSAAVNRYAEVFQVSPDDLIRGKLRPPVYMQSNNEDTPVD